MADETKIEYTFNPWLGTKGVRRKTSEANWKKPLAWERAAIGAEEQYEHLSIAGGPGISSGEPQRPRVFPSLCDIFEEWDGPIVNAKGERLHRHPEAIPGDYIACPHSSLGQPRVPVTLNDIRRDFFDLTRQTPNLNYILATKRPENARSMLEDAAGRLSLLGYTGENIWLLYSASDQATLDAGLPHLLKCRDLVPVLGLSLEPLIGPITLPSLGFTGPQTVPDWVIVGGESGPNARPCNVEWIRSVVEQCRAAGVPCFVKQLGASAEIWDKCADGLGGITGGGGDVPYITDHPKGGDPAEFPNDLRIRQFPSSAGVSD